MGEKMMQRRYCFLVVLILTFSGEISGQNNPCDSSGKSAVIPQPKRLAGCTGDGWNVKPVVAAKPGDLSKLLLPVNYEALVNFDFEKQLRLDYTGDSVKKTSPLILFKPAALPSYTNHLGFFCRKELQMDKISPLAVRFRLGSLEYVNWMEQKPNAIKPLR